MLLLQASFPPPWAGQAGGYTFVSRRTSHNDRRFDELRDREPRAGYGSHLRSCRLGLAILASSVVLKNEGPERKTCKRAEWDSPSASREGTGIQEGSPQESVRNYICGLPRLPCQPEGSTPCPGSFLGWTPPRPGHNGAPLRRGGRVKEGFNSGCQAVLGAAGSNMT